MLAADVYAVQALLGWMAVTILVGCYVIWRYYERVKPRRAEFERQWQRRFEPNLPNVAPYAQHAERDAQLEVDAAYLRLMNELPDDHLPADWRLWGDKSGAPRARR